MPVTGGQPPGTPGRAGLSDLIEDMDRAGVTASLVVLPEHTGEFRRLAEEHPGRLFGLALYDSLSPLQGLERVRTSCRDHPGLIVGVATAMPRFGQDPRLRDFVPLYEYCMERDLPIQFHGEDAHEGKEVARPMALAVLATTYPRLNVVCRSSGNWHGEPLALLHRLPNLFLQVDGFSPHALLHATGGRKLLFGSHRRGREARYFDQLDAVRRLPWRLRQDVGWRTAVRVYGPHILAASSRIHP
jgi:predicted TIM-barrel fold metal-dependent hydrolase